MYVNESQWNNHFKKWLPWPPKNSLILASMLYCQCFSPQPEHELCKVRGCAFSFVIPVHSTVLAFTNYWMLESRKENIKLHNGILGYNPCLHSWMDLISSYIQLNAWKYFFSSSRHKFFRRKWYLIMYRWNRIITQKRQEPPIVPMTGAERSWPSLNSKQLLHAGPWTKT